MIEKEDQHSIFYYKFNFRMYSLIKHGKGEVGL